MRYVFVDLLYFFCLVFAMPLCASVYMCLVVSCWERADLLVGPGDSKDIDVSLCKDRIYALH